jgi:HD-GYP domain-containing protein (c-di-GMP phosphodiesterase class II)
MNRRCRGRRRERVPQRHRWLGIEPTILDALRRPSSTVRSASRASMQRSRHASRLAERHPELGPHADTVAELAHATAIGLGLADEEIRNVRLAAELHDVGKVAVPDSILRKPGPLDQSEWEFIRRHTLIGERIIAAAPALETVARLVRSSHERWDGAGYPTRSAASRSRSDHASSPSPTPSTR